MQKVRKAIFPVGGLGTRFLPATKALPKEMLPIVDKPLIQYAVEEAADAGIEEFIFVTGRNKSAIEDHFDHSFELESTLSAKNKKQALGTVQQMLALKNLFLLLAETNQPLKIILTIHLNWNPPSPPKTKNKRSARCSK